MISNKRFWTGVFCAWLIFVGIDFFFHASILKDVWGEQVVGIKSQNELFKLIPIGYASFLILTLLIAFIYSSIFKENSPIGQVMGFAIIFSGLFSLSNLLGLHSYVEIPLKQLVLFNTVYFIEIFAVVLMLRRTYSSEKLRSPVGFSIGVTLLLMIIGAVLQNLI